MKYRIKRQRRIAAILLTIISINILLPSTVYALTSGPAQPETKGFQPAGVSDMVDLQTGDFKYNIPLLDIDGYPINLNYASGTGMDDEASWVGLGWSLNPGAINRQVKGIPDDFSGDAVETDHYTKPKVTIGGRVTAKVEFSGIGINKLAGNSPNGSLGINGSFTFGVFSDNYTGIGAELGVNAGISYSTPNKGLLTAGLGVGVLSSTQTGVDVTPYASLSVKAKSDEHLTERAGMTASLGYNTRSGMKGYTLGATFGLTAKLDDEYRITQTNPNDPLGGINITDIPGKSGSGGYSFSGSTISFNTPAISPSIQIPYHTKYDSFSFDVGANIYTVYGSLGGTGYESVREVQSVVNTRPAYGFLYAERGRDNKNAVMDFIRENDNPIVPGIPNIALPVSTPDVWTYTSQTGSGQFRLFRRGTGAFFDNETSDVSDVHTTGGDFGAGLIFHGGVTHYEQNTSNVTRKWKTDNNYLNNPDADFKTASTTDPKVQNVYFRQVGEKNLEDQDVNNVQANTNPTEVDISGTTANANYIDPTGTHPLGSLNNTKRRANHTSITYITAGEAANNKGALDRLIRNYQINDINTTFVPTPEPVPDGTTPQISRASDATNYRKNDHISELTVTDEGGKRMVYGIPVYNISQDEYSFAVGVAGKDYDVVNANQVVKHSGSHNSWFTDSSNPQPGTDMGVDYYYHKESKPAYATSYLLSAILSPDYVDKTGDGVTPDDAGTAIKFNYSKLPYAYKWRTPYQAATLNKCLLADPEDDKASIVYGTKEVWYVQSIESKTKIAYFITQDRSDAVGVVDWKGGIDNTNTQKCLREIRLYSKADMTRPIKVVKFQYDYSLCQGIPNSLDFGNTTAGVGGKLTLTKVWFEYGNSDKGKFYPYTFSYNQTSIGGPGNYDYMTTDRWGTYKKASENSNGLSNEEYPYTNQDKTYADQNASLWHLSSINLPTGGVIDVTYESGDYAYVQNKRAMVMTGITAMIANAGDGNGVTALNQAHGLRLSLGTGNTPPTGQDPTAWFENTFLNGNNYLYTKLKVQVSTGLSDSQGADADFIPVYCKINYVRPYGTNGMVDVMFNDITESNVTTNPISIAAWQRIKNEYPRYAYPGYDNRVKSENSNLAGAVSAIVDAARNLHELTQSFYQKANERGYASGFNLSQSFVKIVKIDGFKLGGGARVKKIQISDNWHTMSSSGNTNNVASYGQAYDYTMDAGNNQRMSSGVASYEPSVGNDENAMKQPVPYMQHIQGAINNYFSLEEPFGESYFPAPSIAYSVVTVNDLDKNHNASKQTGYTVNEFYTAKDFPVKVTALPLISNEVKDHSYFSFIETNSSDELCLSQGYSIEVNDMHGKPKAVRIFNQSDAEIASTVYTYNSTDTGGGVLALDNRVSIVNPDGTVSTNQVIGQDIDYFTDFREQESNNLGKTVNIGADVIPFPFFIPFLILPHFPIQDNNDHSLFRSACSVKVIQRYGILSKVVKTQNGSSITSQDLAYDGVTGQPIVSQTQNEFKKNIYSVNIPAYWAYPGMGPASQTAGVMLSGLSTDGVGEINYSYYSFLNAGDEFIDLTPGSTTLNNHYWVLNESINTANLPSGTAIYDPLTYNPVTDVKYTNTTTPSKVIDAKLIIDRDGRIQTGFAPSLIKVVRSGNRNMLSAGITSVVCLNNPIVTDSQSGTHLQLAQYNSNTDLTLMKVLNASATTFDDNWSVEQPDYQQVEDFSHDWTMYGNTVDAAYTTLYGNQDVPNVFNDPYDPSNVSLTGNFWAQRLPYSGIKCSDDNYFNMPYVMGVYITFNLPGPGTYVIGYGANGVMSFGFDCPDNLTPVIKSNQSLYHWQLLSYDFATAGPHTLFMRFNNYVSSGTSVPATTGAVEIYSNTMSQILADDDGTNVGIVFSTRSAVGQKFQSYRQPTGGDAIGHFNYTDLLKTPVLPCTTPPNGSVNPYVYGFKGNWRPYQTKVYQQSRTYNDIFNPATSGIDVKNAGYINNFFTDWYCPMGQSTWVENGAATRWTIANTVTQYDKYGQQLENRDALNRYSAAKFDFYGELPSAVASNARNREIYANSFEDVGFAPGHSDFLDIIPFADFKENITDGPIAASPGQNVPVTASQAHSGNYSANLIPGGFTLSTNIYNNTPKTSPYLLPNLTDPGTTAVPKAYFGLYKDPATAGLYPRGFEPIPGKPYIFNVWVNDGYPNDKSINVALNAVYSNLTGSTKTTVSTASVSLKCKAVVEGWKLLEGVINVDANANFMDLTVTATSSASTYIDDMRIHPFDSHMKTYAYDNKTMRLMAELDENAFATFYEYDDEGLLIRVKKETEKGIMTLKESRSSYKKTP